MQNTYTVTPQTASRTINLLAFHGGDINMAAHDIRIGLQSLGGYTDRRSEAVLSLLNRLSALTPERKQSWLDKLAAIAATVR